jgi:hypothetical protein
MTVLVITVIEAISKVHSFSSWLSGRAYTYEQWTEQVSRKEIYLYRLSSQRDGHLGAVPNLRGRILQVRVVVV